MSDLARLSLTSPEFLAVHAHASEATPQRLKQFYVSIALHRKLDLLWFFIKTHQKQRTVVFMATCKQVQLPRPRVIGMNVMTEIRLACLMLHWAQQSLKVMAAAVSRPI